MRNLVLLTDPAQVSSLPFTFLWIIAMVGIFYFLMYRPQKKQQKKQALLLSSIEAGDSVVTTSGFYGVILDVMDDTVIVEFGNNKNCRIPMKKSAIVEVDKGESAEQ